MPLKIDIRCQKCGQMLYTKIIPGRRGESEYGGIEIKCPNCGQFNLNGVNTEIPNENKAPDRTVPYGQRVRYSNKEVYKPGGKPPA